MARLICPFTGMTVDVPDAAAAASLTARGYKPAEEPKPKPRRRTAKPKTQPKEQ
jgi:hypothetical protein